jgi:drug/metabolite transporter (DMT)-like permease
MKFPASITPARRRYLAVVLVLVGVLLLFLAPETWGGLALLLLGVCIEVAGLALGHTDAR